MKLSEDFFQEEILADTFVSQALKEVWAVNLDLLDCFQRFCQKHQLRFFMGFGTLLGAFRHQGFVPWDDDVDILMPRRDFEKLKGLWSEFSAPYFLQNSLSEPDFWYRGMMKFRRSDTTCLQQSEYQNRHTNQGIALEIMPLDRCPDTAVEQRQQAAQVGYWQRLLWAKGHEQDYHCLQSDSLSAMGDKAWESLRAEAASYTFTELERCYLAACQKAGKISQGPLAVYISYNPQDAYLLFDAAWFEESVLMDFEGLQLPAPAGFWSCLERFYGAGFMGYVPKEHRRPHHPALWDPVVPYSVWQQRILDIYPDCADQSVILFGTGNMAEIFYRQNHERLNLHACVDNNSRMWGKSFYDLPVKSPEYLLEMSPEKRHIIICNGYYREIGAQLQQMGIREYFVYVDDIRVLFQAPGKANQQTLIPRRPYCIAGIILQEEVFDIGMLARINEARKNTDYLVAFVRSPALKQITAALRMVDRAVLLADTIDNAVLCEKYHCEVIFDE